MHSLWFMWLKLASAIALLGRNQTGYFWSFGTETDCILFLLVKISLAVLSSFQPASLWRCSSLVWELRGEETEGLSSLSTNVCYVKASKAL